MSEVPFCTLSPTTVRPPFTPTPTTLNPTTEVSKPFLAHKIQPAPRTLQQDYAQSPMVVLWGEGLFLMSLVPLLDTLRLRFRPCPLQSSFFFNYFHA